MKCQMCNQDVIIEGHHTYEEYGIDDKNGYVYNLTCCNEDCDVESILIYIKS